MNMIIYLVNIMNTSVDGIWWLMGLVLFHFYVFPTLTALM